VREPWSTNCSGIGMGGPAPTRLLAAALVLLLAAPCARAEGPTNDPRIRALVTGGDQFIAEGIARSRTIRALVDRLEHSDMVVYVRNKPLSPLIRGHLLFMTATPERRYVLIEIACGQSWNTQLSALGHELRHAVEVADAPSIRTPQDLKAYYSHAGAISRHEPQHEGFETDQAIDAGRQVARELTVNDGTGATTVRHTR
jgi:hypothetical protein